MISIAMTTYNGEKYIIKQLESLLNQTRKADEVIIVDDVSSDSTVMLVERFIKEHQLKHWKLYTNSENLGYKKNFYKSISRTSGDLIFLCDQDDEWLPDKLEKIEAVFAKHKNVLAVNTTFQIIDQDSKAVEYNCRKGSYNNDLIRGKCNEGQLKRIDYNTIMKYNISPGCTMAFRKSIKEVYLKNSLNRLPHDWEINIIAAQQNGLAFLNDPLINYRIHGKNTLGMNTDDTISDFEFKGNIDFRKSAIEDRILFKSAMDEWNQKLKPDFSQLKIYNDVVKYDLLRKECVFEHRMGAWIQLVFVTLRMWDGKHIRFKTLFGDLYYILKNKTL